MKKFKEVIKPDNITDKVESTKKNNNVSTAAKVALGILGVGFVAGTTVVLGVDRVMKKIFVNEDWPDEEWSADDWAEEDLED